ncbi:E3 ubiquitin-protein ligase ATL23 [Striga hermonthica]|uniref:E3 ubiquitin-protein ligase ATL23 n=1 Tax=Striga hermonthica TaxID=68872 RepID=A0A9N7R2S8_STRHE|nr:E3 ubiquitin-protein ligase ATL23 [Striga hermonthica]
MLVSLVLALFLPCAGMAAVFLVYVCLLFHSAGAESRDLPVKRRPDMGLSASDLERLPKVAGKELALGGECAVCLDEIEGEQAARVLPGCSHGFHLQCADAWLSRNSICPVCRGTVGPHPLDPSQSIPC